MSTIGITLLITGIGNPKTLFSALKHLKPKLQVNLIIIWLIIKKQELRKLYSGLLKWEEEKKHTF